MTMEGGFDMEALLQRAQAMQQQVVSAQAAAAEQVVEGQAGGGVVRVRVTGDLAFQSVSIAPEVVDPEDVAMLEDLVLAACTDAVERARSLGQEVLGDLDLGDLGLGGMGGSRGGDLGGGAGDSGGTAPGTVT